MLRQLVSLTMIELPLSIDLDLDHILELSQLLSPKQQVATSFASTVLNAMQDSILPNQEITLDPILK